MLKNLRKKKKGFTLIELIIVVAILAILAAVALPRLGNITKSANASADEANIKTIKNAVSILQAENKLTDTEYTLDSTIDNEVEEYLQTVPTPSTGGNYVVEIDENGIITVTPPPAARE